MVLSLSLLSPLALLIIEGTLLGSLLLGSRPWRLTILALGLPIGTLLNAGVFFTLHLLHISFSILSVWSMHVAILLSLAALSIRLGTSPPLSFEEYTLSLPLRRLIVTCCAVFLFFIVLSSATYALFMPSLFWDTFTNWAMRSQQSLAAGTFLVEGVTQPQYPILLHSLQMLPVLDHRWSDFSARTMTLFLTFTIFLSFFLFQKERSGFPFALLCLTLLLSIPLTALHLRQGYADIHVSGFFLLSAIFLEQALLHENRRFLLLSALFVTAAASTKYEGLYFGTVPWTVIVTLWSLHKKCTWPLTFGILPALLLAGLWPLAVILQGLPPSPHGFHLTPHLDLFPLVLQSLFLMGTFGMHWWAILALTLFITWQQRQRLFGFPLLVPILSWGWISTILVIGVYLFTQDVDGLIQGDNFSRALLGPTMLLTYSLAQFFASHMKFGKFAQTPQAGMPALESLRLPS